MDALLMCGGRGTRLDADEKPLVEVRGRPVVGRVREALAESAAERVHAVTSPHAPATAAWLDLPRIETPGDGYVADLAAALADDRVERPVLTVAADLPLLSGAALDAVLSAHDGGSLAAVVPVGRVRALGYSVDTAFRAGGALVRPTGVNVVGTGDETTWLARDPRLVANVNRPGDRATAEWWLARDRAFPD